MGLYAGIMTPLFNATTTFEILALITGMSDWVNCGALAQAGRDGLDGYQGPPPTVGEDLPQSCPSSWVSDFAHSPTLHQCWLFSMPTFEEDPQNPGQLLYQEETAWYLDWVRDFVAHASAHGVKYFAVHNEPNYWAAWRPDAAHVAAHYGENWACLDWYCGEYPERCGGPNPAQYGAFLMHMSDAIRDVCPSCKVVIGSMAGTGIDGDYHPQGLDGKPTWLDSSRYMYYHFLPELHQWFTDHAPYTMSHYYDIFSLNLYPNPWQGSTPAAGARAMLNQLRDWVNDGHSDVLAGRELWIQEMGIEAGVWLGQPWDGITDALDDPVNEAQVAEWLGGMYDELLHASPGELRPDRIFMYGYKQVDHSLMQQNAGEPYSALVRAESWRPEYNYQVLPYANQWTTYQQISRHISGDIDRNTYLTQDTWVDGDVYVKPGVILCIGNSNRPESIHLHMAAGSRIVVEAGAKLCASHVWFMCTGGQEWAGITVDGGTVELEDLCYVANLSGDAEILVNNQGHLTANGATIFGYENSPAQMWRGIKVQGGVVDLNNVTIWNAQKGVYLRRGNGASDPIAATITNCLFEDYAEAGLMVNALYNDQCGGTPGVWPHVSGCTFDGGGSASAKGICVQCVSGDPNAPWIGNSFLNNNKGVYTWKSSVYLGADNSFLDNQFGSQAVGLHAKEPAYANSWVNGGSAAGCSFSWNSTSDDVGAVWFEPTLRSPLGLEVSYISVNGPGPHGYGVKASTRLDPAVRVSRSIFLGLNKALYGQGGTVWAGEDAQLGCNRLGQNTWDVYYTARTDAPPWIYVQGNCWAWEESPPVNVPVIGGNQGDRVVWEPAVSCYGLPCWGVEPLPPASIPPAGESSRGDSAGDALALEPQELHPDVGDAVVSDRRGFELVISEDGPIEAVVYDLLGRVVSRLRPIVGDGQHVLRWDGMDSARRPVANGVYIVRVIAEKSVTPHRVVVLR